MSYKSLNHFVTELEKTNNLVRIKEFVNPELEITEIVDRVSKSTDGGKALLFENTGTQFPVLINSMGSEKRMCLALGVSDLDDVGKEIESLFVDLAGPKLNLMDKLKMLPTLSNISSWMPKTVSGKGACQEVILNDPDLSILPVLKCWPEDGGPFVTLPIVHTLDPKTGIRNVGMYRMQILDKNSTGMHWHKHKVGARHFNEYKQLGKHMPVAVALGGDPAYTYAATAPLPDNLDEYLLAGFLRKKKVELVKCITQDIEVPADADIIIEGYIDTNEDFIWEGPFGDHTGFYSLADWYPRFHVTCITHRKNAIYPATIVGVPPMEDAWIGKATERIFLTPIKLTVLPEIIDYNLPFQGIAHNIAIVKINKTFPGQAFKVMNAMWGAGQMMFNKIMIVVDNKVDIQNYSVLTKLISQNVIPENDIHFIKGPLDVLDHSSSKFTYGSKMGIDATTKFEEEKVIDEPKNDSETKIDFSILKSYFPEINDVFAIPEYSILIISLKKENKQKLIALIESSAQLKELNDIKFCFIVDHFVDVKNLNMIAWIASGNIDPQRDSVIISAKTNSNSKIFIDATRKSYEKDGFMRDWPNVVVSDLKTIKAIDEKWDCLGLGQFIQSPSIQYRKLNFNDGAIATD